MCIQEAFTLKKKKKQNTYLQLKKKMLGEAVFPLKGQGFFKEGKKQPKKKKDQGKLKQQQVTKQKTVEIIGVSERQCHSRVDSTLSAIIKRQNR